MENPITYWCGTYGVVTNDQWPLCPNNVRHTIITGNSDGSRKSPELPTLHIAARSARYWQSNVHINLPRFPGTQTRPALPCHCYGESHRSHRSQGISFWNTISEGYGWNMAFVHIYSGELRTAQRNSSKGQEGTIKDFPSSLF